jgi:hypothetical protein
VPQCPSHHEEEDDDNVVQVDRWDINKNWYIKYDKDWNWIDWNAAVSYQQQQQQPTVALMLSCCFTRSRSAGCTT